MPCMVVDFYLAARCYRFRKSRQLLGPKCPLAGIINSFQECSLIMEAERINQIDASLVDLAERTLALRRYL